MEKTSVFIADWQVLFREGIHFTLSGEEDMEVIGEEVDSERALAFLETNPPQVAILNAGREKPSGIETTRRIKQNLPDVSVILILDNVSDEQLFAVAKSGASAWLTKDVDPEVVIDTVREVARGNQPITETLLKPEIASRVLDQFEVFTAVGEKVGGMLAHLTPQEAEILRYLAEGKPREEIAGMLNLGEEGISHRIASILHKLVANDQKLMLIEAAQGGLSPLSRISLTGRPATDYITREEFAAFKESLKERFRSLGGEIE